MARRPRPTMNADSAFFWEGVEKSELCIQRCKACGTLRHPPRPMCSSCRSLEWDSVTASGRGEVYSFVVHHHPPVPGFDPPFVVAVVQLEEGTRIIGNVIDIDSADVRVGMAVQVCFVPVHDEWTLPLWRRREGS